MPTPDLTTFFVAVQHPAELGGVRPASYYEDLSTRWPDVSDTAAPVVAITRQGGGKIGA